MGVQSLALLAWWVVPVAHILASWTSESSTALTNAVALVLHLSAVEAALTERQCQQELSLLVKTGRGGKGWATLEVQAIVEDAIATSNTILSHRSKHDLSCACAVVRVQRFCCDVLVAGRWRQERQTWKWGEVSWEVERRQVEMRE